MKISSPILAPTLGVAASFALIPACSAAEPGAVIYTWSGNAVRQPSTNPWKGELVTRPDGTSATQASGTGMGYNNYIAIPKTNFKAGHDYTAVIKYEIVSPTKFPDSFYLFARSSKLGQGEDYWTYFNGDPGQKGIAKLTLSLKGKKLADDWMVYGGCKGPGTMIIDSLQILEGNGYQFTPPTPAAKPAVAPAIAKVPTGFVPFKLEPPAAKQGLVLDAKDFGMVADKPGEPVSQEVAAANFTAISAALKAAREKNASVLTFPKGTYRFYSKFALPFTDLKDITIDGQGSDFIFTQYHTGVEAVSVYRCERVVIKNLNFDWDWSVTPIASFGKVVSLSEDAKSLEVTFPDLTEAQVAIAQKSPWMSAYATDPATLTRSVFERASISVANVEPVNASTLKLNLKSPTSLKVGGTYVFRHLYYDFGCFKIGSCKDLAFDRTTIYSIPGMGWFLTSDIRNFKMTNCRVARREGSRNPLTTAADGFHISQSQGNILLENCEFTGSGDDSINIHDNCFQGVQRVDDNTLTLVNCPPWRIRLNNGDKIALFNSDYSPQNFSTIAKTVEFKDKNTTITTADPLPANVSPLSIVQNQRFNTSNVGIINCKFHDTNGRSILLSTQGGSIEGCTFKNAVGTCIQLHTEIVQDLWAEGAGATNIVIRNNTFDTSAFEGRYDSAVVYSGAKLPAGVTSYPLFRDILIEKNHFINPFGPAVSLNSAANIIVRDNLIEAPQPPSIATYLANTIFAANTKASVISANTWKNIPATSPSGLAIDPSNTSDLTTTQNVSIN